MRGLRAAHRGIRSGREEAMAEGRISCVGKTYTFYAQDVYVSRSKRIRFHRQTYTLCSQYVYVLMRRGIRSGRATDEAGTLSEGEGRAKAQALGEGSSGLHAIEGYSKPPAGTTRTAAGGFALAGVTQERER